MAFADAFTALNGFRRRGIIKGYAVIGAVAATAYMEPVFTEDIHVIILVDSDEEYQAAFRSVSDESEGQDGMHQVLAGIPVQLFPSTISPLHREAVAQARKVRIDNLTVRVAAAEYLVVLYLLAFRERDRIRVRYLLQDLNQELLNSLLERFDDGENTLARRLQDLRRTSIPREGEVAPTPSADELQA